MIKNFFGNRTIRKVAIFAAGALLTCLAAGIRAVSPEPVPGPAPYHVSPSPEVRSAPETSYWLSQASMLETLTDSSFHTMLLEAYLAQKDGGEHTITVMRPIMPSAPSGPFHDTLGFKYLSEISLSEELQLHTYNRCQELGLEYEMVLAIMWRESRFQPRIVGINQNGTKDSGLMQINDINREWLEEKHGIVDLLDPYQNIDAGCAILSQFFSKYGENQALMAYQYGENGMLQRLNEGVSTNELTEKVKNKRDEYKNMRESAHMAR